MQRYLNICNALQMQRYAATTLRSVDAALFKYLQRAANAALRCTCIAAAPEPTLHPRSCSCSVDAALRCAA